MIAGRIGTLTPTGTMQTPLTSALTKARADWLAGDATAWVRYTACLRQIEALKKARTQPAPRPMRRPRAQA